MPSSPLSRETLLSIELSAIMSRNRYTRDPDRVVDELFTAAGSNRPLLAAEIGSWLGYYEDRESAPLCAALRALPLPLEEGIRLGQDRRRAGTHDMRGYQPSQ